MMDPECKRCHVRHPSTIDCEIWKRQQAYEAKGAADGIEPIAVKLVKHVVKPQVSNTVVDVKHSVSNNAVDVKPQVSNNAVVKQSNDCPHCADLRAENAELRAQVVALSGPPSATKAERAAYMKDYMRDYMRVKRAKAKGA